MPIRRNYEIGDPVIVDSDSRPVYGRIVGRYFGRHTTEYDIMPDGERNLKGRLICVAEDRISPANSEVSKMVAAYNKPASEEPKHVRDEA